MSGYYHRIWICPFYTQDTKDNIVCKAGKVKFKDMESAHKYFEKFCASYEWEGCSLAASLIEYMERTDEDEYQNKG